MTENSKLKDKLLFHSELIDRCFFLNAKGRISDELALKEINYHRGMMLKLMIDEYGYDVMANIISFMKEL